MGYGTGKRKAKVCRVILLSLLVPSLLRSSSQGFCQPSSHNIVDLFLSANAHTRSLFKLQTASVHTLEF